MKNFVSKLRENNIRINRYHLKMILLIMFIGSCSFIFIDYPKKHQELGVWNNFGVDCDKVQQIIKGEIVGNLTDLMVNGYLEDDEAYDFYFTRRTTYWPLMNCLDADDPILTNKIRDELMIKPPRNKSFLRVLNQQNLEFAEGKQATDIRDMIFKNKKNGFYIEAGAYDCESISVTLPFEYHYGWTGILIETMPYFFTKCKQWRTDRAKFNWTQVQQPFLSHFDIRSNIQGGPNDGVYYMQGIVSKKNSPLEVSIKLQCYPLYSILLSLGNPTVNLFVLDIEGFELGVLQTIPWNKVDIEVLDIETDLAGVVQKDSSREKIIDFMYRKGYDRFDHTNDFNPVTEKKQNDLFVRRDIVKKYNVKQLPIVKENN